MALSCLAEVFDRVKALDPTRAWISSDGDKPGFYDRWKATQPHVPVFGITFGDADRSQLDALARETGGRVFDGRSSLADAFRAARGYN